MKPAWDQLGDKFAGSSVVIGDADCTVETELCQRFGVQGYPTIKYFSDETANDGDKYQGGREFDDLDKFVTENLAKNCDVESGADCDERESGYIEKFKALPEKVSKELTRLQGMVGKKMKPELTVWLKKRINVLKQLAGVEGKDEL